MRLHRLEIEGFGPFRARQVVDFDAFADDGIFLIGGRTGAGKSSILDAVCFGLYGGVPRYDGGEKRLRSDHSDPEDRTEVVVEFSTVAGRFRVTRSPEYLRPAKRGGGLTKQAPAVALEEWTDAGWIGRAARAVDVANELAEILQLTQEQFLQVILLAQNRFSEFLLADSRDRQKLLRRLFGTERFEDYQSRFDERRRAAEQTLGGRRATVEATLAEADRLVADAELGGDGAVAEAEAPGGADERIEALRRALARGEYRAERLGAERDAAERTLSEADVRLGELREQRQAQADRDRARAALAALDAEAEEIAASRVRLDRGRAAEALRAVIAAAARAETARDAAAAAQATARAAWAGHGIDAGPLREWVTARTRESGAWQRAAELERTAPERAQELATSQDAVDRAVAALAEVDRERAELPALVAELTGLRDAARREGDRVEDLARAEADADARRAAAADGERLAVSRAEAERRTAEAAVAHAQAQAAVATLRQRRLDGYAGELAAALVAGEPCAVCGAIEHPHPAARADPVSADDVADAERIRDEAAARERAAASAEAAVGAELAAATARADGRTAEQADAELAAARDAHTAARDAAARAQEHDALLAQAVQRSADSDAQRAAAADHVAAVREELVRCEQRTSEADRVIAEARGEDARVADRLARVAAQIAAATAAADAADELSARTTAAAEAVAERDEALRGSAFDDTADAESALVPPAALAALEDRLTAHAVQREKERAILLELELRTLPEEPIDLAPHEQASVEARAGWMRAVDGANRAAQTAQALGGLIAAAETEHAASAEDQAEFEVLRGLADTLAGRGANTHKMNLETFVLAAELEEIVTAANVRLGDMSAGRYQLRHSDALAARGAASGLGIVVFDAFTGQTRPAQSLSGGETFLGSLALALGLAEVVTARAGGIRLDTLFIDEGFGSLDAETLEVAMRTLDELRSGGRTVGVISHVEAMQEQIPAQITVRTTPDGPSVIEA
ncbi:SMC family ATPase [Microbacterium capsulatum]|uniref:Nuclease SbcCD subunit C n=1 Tax=Microbacterium capsulatum TaxID=3041921 RepID=A0ABU0XKC2_9MICO|nr:SMC family ATPase [Microbacterium sp. ASV81]MDQ4215556.1 SMC family ATPase [Microbacterium sp. ASV81]